MMQNKSVEFSDGHLGALIKLGGRKEGEGVGGGEEREVETLWANARKMKCVS